MTGIRAGLPSAGVALNARAAHGQEASCGRGLSQENRNCTTGINRKCRRLAYTWGRSGPLRRFTVFNAVGAMGAVVQLSLLAFLTHGLGMPYLVATVLAVEAAVLHNFLWHERWTWRERLARNPKARRERLVRFHLANGALSMAGNLALMRLFVGAESMNTALANILSIMICSALNFLAGDRVVFHTLASPCERATGRWL